MEEDLRPKGKAEAMEIQHALMEIIRIIHLKKTPRFIAAADAAFSGDFVFAAATLHRLPGFVLEKYSLAKEGTRFPYIPGLLAFREGHAIRKLAVIPDELTGFQGR